MTNQNHRDAISLDLTDLLERLTRGLTIRLGNAQFTVSLASPEELALHHEQASAEDDELDEAFEDEDDDLEDVPASERSGARRRARTSQERVPDGRAVREFLAPKSEGATLTVLSREFGVRRQTMSKLLARLLKKGEVEIYKGSYYNNRRLRRRRLAFTPPPVAAGPTPAPFFRSEEPATPAPKAPTKPEAPSRPANSPVAAGGAGPGAGAGPSPADADADDLPPSRDRDPSVH